MNQFVYQVTISVFDKFHQPMRGEGCEVHAVWDRMAWWTWISLAERSLGSDPGKRALPQASSYLSCMPVLQEHTSFRRSRLLSVTAVIM